MGPVNIGTYMIVNTLIPNTSLMIGPRFCVMTNTAIAAGVATMPDTKGALRTPKASRRDTIDPRTHSAICGKIQALITAE